MAEADDATMTRVIGTFESADEARAWVTENEKAVAYFMDAMVGSRLTVLCLDSGIDFIEDQREAWADANV